MHLVMTGASERQVYGRIPAYRVLLHTLGIGQSCVYKLVPHEGCWSHTRSVREDQKDCESKKGFGGLNSTKTFRECLLR